MFLMTAVNIRHNFLTTVAYLGNNLKARRAISDMASQCALMTTWKDFLAIVIASRLRSVAHNRRVNFGCSTRAI